ncbi:MAG: hypothetical protein QNJ46_04200 [Leptolyngbyaceae cyanobacterium MO_188.B28]|nr:hypothetical protein [Leptolyngbyaceae cyanobacterium MO_188.B28]
MKNQFLEAVFTGGIQHPNFFNGRILTATDLRDEQKANLQRSRYLGQAIGTGVVYGLEISADANQTSLVITPGLAINRRGEGLFLPGAATSRTTKVELVQTKLLGKPTSPFAPCEVAGATNLTGTVSTGYYLLAITSATRPSNTMAPNSGLEGDRLGCTNRYEEVGVRFKLIPLTNDDFVSQIPHNALNRRSRLAHACFGSNALRKIYSQPLEQSLTYGLVDDLYQQDGRLTLCDVPLAVFQFQSQSLQFVDMWAVRRVASPTLHPETYLSNPFGFYVSSRRSAEAAAFLLQFQDHLEDLSKDKNLVPAEVVAKEHFEYLPAAGYLPIQKEKSDLRFKVDTFFGPNKYKIATELLEPERLRLLLHDSFYEESIRPGIDAVDIYQLRGASTDKPYRIFVRHSVMTAAAAETDKVKEDTPTLTSTGDLYVKVLSTTGEEIAEEYIQSVKAIHQKTRVIRTIDQSSQLPFKSLRQSRYQGFLQEAKTQTRHKYSFGERIRFNTVDDYVVTTEERGPYYFNDLPTGSYTVEAISTQKDYYGVSESVDVTAGTDNYTQVILRKRHSESPSNIFRGDDSLLSPGGIRFRGGSLHTDWPKFYRKWENDLFGPDIHLKEPPATGYMKLENPALSIQIERLLNYPGLEDPRVATANPVLYIRKDYRPDQPRDKVAAFVQTADGSRFIAIPGAVDNALDKTATVDRTGILDFDRATVEQLQRVGLADLETFSNAPAKLIAGVLKQSPSYSASLIAETRQRLQEDFRHGYMAYPGIGKIESDALKGAYPHKVDLANANPDAVTNILLEVKLQQRGGITDAERERVRSQLARYIPRLLSNVQNVLPSSSFTLDGTTISKGARDALATIDVVTNADFRGQAATLEGRERLKAVLLVNDETLDRYRRKAAVGYALGKLASIPDQSVAMLDNVSDDIASRLVQENISSAKELARQNSGDLAQTLKISGTEAGRMVDEAKALFAEANSVLIQTALQGIENAESKVERIAIAFKSPSDIAQANLTDLEGTDNIIDATVAAKLKAMGEAFENQRSTLLNGHQFIATPADRPGMEGRSP